MSKKNSIMTKTIQFQTPPTPVNNRVGWRVDDFEKLIQSQGYDALIDRALRCPCVDKATGQALSTCKNCLGRGWIFIDRTETRVIAQSMDNKQQYQDWGEVNHGTASITTKGVDNLGFMDRVILTQNEAHYSEVLRPFYYSGEIIAYPIYEPLVIDNIFLFCSDTEKLLPLSDDKYTISGNKIIFSLGIGDWVDISDMNIANKSEISISVSVRYSHYPVFHVVQSKRELMKVRESSFCSFSDEDLRQMPINVTARKAHYLFDSQRYGDEIFENNSVSDE